MTEIKHLYEVRPRKDKRGAGFNFRCAAILLSETSLRHFRRTSWNGSTSLLPNHIENVFATLRVTRIIFESQMANDAAP